MECFHEGLSREVIMSVKGNAITQKDQLAKKCYSRMIELYEKSYSELLELFFGIQVWTTRVIKDGQPQEPEVEDMNPDPFMSIDLWLNSQAPMTTLTDCIAKNMEPEEVEGFTDSEGNQKQRILRFWSLPQVLMINIKRYTIHGQKIRTPVTPDEEIDLSPYVIGYTKGGSHHYELFAAAIHTGGSIHGGHYYAIIKTANHKWNVFNDTVVKMRLSDASCFFYRKK
jgi:uncharacterized UBP type Zn finger protein